MLTTSPRLTVTVMDSSLMAVSIASMSSKH